MEMIDACSSSIDAADSVDEAQGSRRGPASPSSELGGARWSTAGFAAAAASPGSSASASISADESALAAVFVLLLESSAASS
jgi:hypothetical protein